METCRANGLRTSAKVKAPSHADAPMACRWSEADAWKKRDPRARMRFIAAGPSRISSSWWRASRKRLARICVPPALLMCTNATSPKAG